MKVFISCFIAFLMASCNNDNDANTTTEDSMTGETIHATATDTIITNAQPMQLAGCYQMVFKKDSADMHLNVKDTIVSGTLNFNLYQKDKNKGTIHGVWRNDKIYADYSFQSEGMTSVREVIFKIDDGNLVQAFGDLTEKDGKLVFTDKDQLQYQTANPFIKTDCP